MNPAWFVVGGVAVVWLIYSGILPELIDLFTQTATGPLGGQPAQSAPPATPPPQQWGIQW